MVMPTTLVAHPRNRFPRRARWPRWLAGAAVALMPASPVAAVTFTDVTTSAGLTHVHATTEVMLSLGATGFYAGGAAAGDFDGDGRVDLVFTRLDQSPILYRNLGNGSFEPRTLTAGFTTPGFAGGVAAGDVDNDGDLDLYMTTTMDTRSYLYFNNGQGVFTDAGLGVTAALASSVVRSGEGVSFGDYDRDGYLDLATGDWGNLVADSQSRLLRNRGVADPGVFDDVTAAAGINVYRKLNTFRFQPRFTDLDRDGQTDLTFAADFKSSQAFWNDGDGTFTHLTIGAGLGTDNNGMGSAFGDYDGDGDLDWFITNINDNPQAPVHGGWNRLYRNDGNRTFVDVTTAAGVRNSGWAWGTSFLDYDNDGDQDLIATNGYNGPGWIDDQTVLWRNDAGVYTNVSTALGITDTQQGRGLIQLDYDADGDQDVLIVNNAAAPILYRNDGGNANHWLRIDAEGTLSNRDGIGAWITVTPDLNDPLRRQVWEIDGGGSFLSQSERIAHFGLGAAGDAVDLITIEWPSGAVQRLFNVAVDQALPVVEPLYESTADFNGDGAVNAADLALWNAGFGQTGVAAYAAGDANGDRRIDGADLLAWQRQLGGATATPAQAQVPEPSSLTLTIAIAASTLLQSRRGQPTGSACRHRGSTLGRPCSDGANRRRDAWFRELQSRVFYRQERQGRPGKKKVD
jgi:hypothetical protein